MSKDQAAEYQVIARKFRPQAFIDVVGQEAIVTTLKNAIRSKRLAQAYLFCGSRGTGKTTLARILAKAINCSNPTSDFEPCNQCASCREITVGSSLDVLEIDGASNRGIEDVRQINETVAYSPAAGQYKIYIIDEVHMLTKEAFNALLKTLEEPPPKVKFFFATTEPQKVLPTILSRCQRFNLNRIPIQLIVNKLKKITEKLGVDAENTALHLIAHRAEGGLRDAESLLDQILAFQEGPVTVSSVNGILGLMPRDTYFEIDKAGKAGQFQKAFEITDQIFSEGKDLQHFVDGLIDHFRQILLIKVAKQFSVNSPLSDEDKARYLSSAQLYSAEQCMDLVEYLLESQTQLRFSSFTKVTLEIILLHVFRSHFRLPIELLVRRLGELEETLANTTNHELTLPNSVISEPVPLPPIAIQPPVDTQHLFVSSPPLPPSPPEKQKTVTAAPPLPAASHVSEDPTPTAADLGKKQTIKKQAPTENVQAKPISNESTKTPLKADPIIQPTTHSPLEKPAHHYDTLFHFSAVELDGKLQRN